MFDTWLKVVNGERFAGYIMVDFQKAVDHDQYFLTYCAQTVSILKMK